MRGEGRRAVTKDLSSSDVNFADIGPPDLLVT